MGCKDKGKAQLVQTKSSHLVLLTNPVPGSIFSLLEVEPTCEEVFTQGGMMVEAN